MSRKAFTLMETMVVIGVVAALAILAFASLSKISSRSKTTGCIHHLRQLHIAFMGYASDNNHTLPLALTGAGEQNAAWMNYLLEGGYLPPYPSPRARGVGRVNHPFFDPGSQVRNVEATVGNYGVNRELLGSSSRTTPNPPKLKLTTVSAPSQRLLLMCAGIYSINRSQAASVGLPNLYLPGFPKNRSVSWQEKHEADAKEGRHNRRINALFLSGSVESLPPEELVSRTEVWKRE